MSWLGRAFGIEVPDGAQVNPIAQAATIPPERLGLNGEYDESGLAKRVALAFDGNAQLANVETLYVAQLSTTVVLKGKVASQALLDQAVAIARSVPGAEAVQTDQVTVG